MSSKRVFIAFLVVTIMLAVRSCNLNEGTMKKKHPSKKSKQ